MIFTDIGASQDSSTGLSSPNLPFLRPWPFQQVFCFCLLSRSLQLLCCPPPCRKAMLGVKPLLKSIRGWMAGNLFSAFLSKVLVSLGGIEQAKLVHGTILTKSPVRWPRRATTVLRPWPFQQAFCLCLLSKSLKLSCRPSPGRKTPCRPIHSIEKSI